MYLFLELLDQVFHSFLFKNIFKTYFGQQVKELMEELLLKCEELVMPMEDEEINNADKIPEISGEMIDLAVAVAADSDSEEYEVSSEWEEDGGEIEVEEYYVKYKSFSYLHCEWRTRDELVVSDKRIDQKIKRFKLKKVDGVF